LPEPNQTLFENLKKHREKRVSGRLSVFRGLSAVGIEIIRQEIRSKGAYLVRSDSPTSFTVSKAVADSFARKRPSPRLMTSAEFERVGGGIVISLEVDENEICYMDSENIRDEMEVMVWLRNDRWIPVGDIDLTPHL
jgi:hypothetical protein